MARITLLARSSRKNPGKINVRFRLRDGRAVDITYGSKIKANPADLEKFTPEGKLKPKITVYDRDLLNQIKKEMERIELAYKKMIDKGMDLTGEVLSAEIEEMVTPVVKVRKTAVKNLKGAFDDYLANATKLGVVGERRAVHIKIVGDKLGRFLSIKGLTHITPKEFDENLLLEFRDFLYDEYLYVEKYKRLYKKMKSSSIPKDRLSSNTVVSQLKMLQTFFGELEFKREIERSPFRSLSKEHRKVVMKTKYDEPVFLLADELQAVRKAKIAKCYEEIRDVFLVNCAIGCRIADFQALTMDNIAVSPEGIPYVHYLPHKTADEGDTNAEVQTPLARFAFDIIKRTGFQFKILRNTYGKSGYNIQLKGLLKDCGIDRKVPIYNERTKSNEYKPLYEEASTKLARKTHVDMLAKVQINLYAAGLHKMGSSAVNRYTSLLIPERFALINMAFGEDPYTVDKKLEVIEKKPAQKQRAKGVDK